MNLTVDLQKYKTETVGNTIKNDKSLFLGYLNVFLSDITK